MKIESSNEWKAMEHTQQDIEKAHALLKAIKREIHKHIIGQEDLIDALLIGLLSDGHLLLEGVPGIAKTLSANTLAKVIRCQFKRIQFTPDLLPADLTGTPIFNPKEGTFEVKKGPVFTNILLADEINRAPAKVQSALLEIMQEKQVTIGGETFPAPRPFIVLATQNPIEQEGTYPLAEAQTDRFMMKIKINYPTIAEEKMILERIGTMNPLPPIDPIVEISDLFHLRELADNIYLDEKVIDYLLSIVDATRQTNHSEMSDLLEFGASPRASLALKQGAKAKALLAGRNFVTPQDIKDLAPLVLRHRLRPTYQAEAENLTSDDIIQRLLAKIPTP